MCGIFSVFNYDQTDACVDKQCSAANKKTLMATMNDAFYKAQHRGPDNSTLSFDAKTQTCLGFHRLTINGVKNYFGSNQPLHKKNIILLCNGEIYNYKTVLNELDFTEEEKRLYSGSDCEIIIDLYLRFGMDATLELLDGVFAFVLIDLRCNDDPKNHPYPLIYVARDPFGLRPLYWLKRDLTYLSRNGDDDDNLQTIPFGFASEMKQLVPLMDYYNKNEHDYSIKYNLEVVPFPSGHYLCYRGLSMNSRSIFDIDDPLWTIQNGSAIEPKRYFHFPHFRDIAIHSQFEETLRKIRMYLEAAVEKRVTTSDRPIACLLSGGVDSSLICALVKKYLPPNVLLETYSIGLEGSSDEVYVKMVSEHIKSKHTHVQCSKEEFLEAIPDVIRLLETYDVTTVRASVGNYLIGKYIKENSDAVVIFNGDGSDELFGGYKYFLNCPNKYEFHQERKRLLRDIHYFDVLRSEKSMSVNGLEARTPFLDKQLVSFVMTLTSDLTFTPNNKSLIEKEMYGEESGDDEFTCVFDAMKKTGIEKYMLRRAFKGTGLLPEAILMRSKEAFSDGVSSETDSWYIIIQKHIVSILTRDVYKEFPKDLLRGLEMCRSYMKGELTYQDVASSIIEIERWYYLYLYNRCYGHCAFLPYFWMPKYSNETSDPSARTLNVYNNTAKINVEKSKDATITMEVEDIGDAIELDNIPSYCG